MSKTRLASIFAGLTATCITVTAAQADSPDQQNPVTGQEVLQIYSGKTWIWAPGEGGAFWSSDGSFEAFWQDSVGVGKWYATSSGNVCYEARWQTVAADRASSQRQCWRHVKDSAVAVWKLDPQTDDWYRAEFEISGSIIPGNGIEAEVAKLRRQTGL